MKKITARFCFSQRMITSLAAGLVALSAPAMGATLGDSDFEQKTYTLPGNAGTESCTPVVYAIVEELPKGYHSVLAHRDFNGPGIKIVVNKKKSASDQFSFNIMCVNKWRDGTTSLLPIGKVSLP